MTNDSRLERALGRLLQAGVTLSALLLGVGVMVSLLHIGQGELAGILLQAGLLVLIATPIARVAASAISYLIQRDWLFVALTSAVLLELAAAVVAAVQARH